MRIAVWHNLPSGGAKRALHGHIGGLLRRGHEIEAWCPPTADRSFLPLDRLIPEHVVPLSHDRPPPWWTSSRLGLLRSPRPLMDALCAHSRACAGQMRTTPFDVHLIATCQFFASPPIGRYLDGPTALYLQEPQRWLYEANPAFPWLGTPPPTTTRERILYPGRALLEALRTHRRSQRARFEVDNAGAFDALLVSSLFSRETTLRVYGVDAQVCYLGVDTTMFRPLGSAREDMVLGVGTLSRHKNARLLVDAVAALPAPRPRVEWIAASSDERYAAELHEAARRAGVDLRIHAGATDEILVDALNRARALVYMSRLEPFGLVPLEANACGLPVIGVAEGGVRETVADGVNGLLVGSHPSEVAAAIARITRDPALAERMGREGRRIIEERWTLEAAATRLEGALARLAGNSG